MFAGIEGYPDELNVKAVDDTTFEFVLTAPCAYMEDLMAFPTFFPVKQSAVEAFADWQTYSRRLVPERGLRLQRPVRLHRLGP